MALRNILKIGDGQLREKARTVTLFDKRLHELLDDMYETMKAANGVGLAATQVGILKRAAVIDIGEGLIEIINPIIVTQKGKNIESEGCLSIPNHNATVERPAYIKVKAVDRFGNPIEVTGKDFLAKALSHEIDHMDGILFIDKALPPEPENEK